MGRHTVHEEDVKKIESKFDEICKSKASFQRLVISKEEALELFASNPFKVADSTAPAFFFAFCVM